MRDDGATRAVVRASGRLERDAPSGEAMKTMKTAKAREVAARAAIGGDGADRAGVAASGRRTTPSRRLGWISFRRGNIP